MLFASLAMLLLLLFFFFFFFAGGPTLKSNETSDRVERSGETTEEERRECLTRARRFLLYALSASLRASVQISHL